MVIIVLSYQLPKFLVLNYRKDEMTAASTLAKLSFYIATIISCAFLSGIISYNVKTKASSYFVLYFITPY